MEANHLVQLMLECQQPNPLFRAPIRANPKYILDLGTGQGQWYPMSLFKEAGVQADRLQKGD